MAKAPLPASPPACRTEVAIVLLTCLTGYMSSLHTFEFTAGSLSLSFVDTLGGRASRSVERLATPGDLAAWLEAAGLRVGARPDAADLVNARRLRGAIDRAVTAVVGDNGPEAADTDCINGFAAAPPLRPQWAAARKSWAAGAPVAAALSTIAADAIDMLGQGDRLRECVECRMLFLDSSRPGRRRWCSSASGCGNRAKVRKHRARRAGAMA